MYYRRCLDTLVSSSFHLQKKLALLIKKKAFFHPSMFGFNVTAQTYSYDNRPVTPIKNMPFSQWWFHNHLDHPPNPGDVFNLPAGQTATAEIACTRGATSFFAGADGGDIRNASNPNDVCPGSPMIEYHTQGFNDLEGCSLAIAYKSDVKDVQPEDFTVFSVNQTCVWTRFTDFKVPEKMPRCPEGGCICAFFWIHAVRFPSIFFLSAAFSLRFLFVLQPDAGGEESKNMLLFPPPSLTYYFSDYMNGFKCNVTGSTSTVPLATSKVARRCGADPANQKMQSAPGNCTYGAKTPFYWFNNERNNVRYFSPSSSQIKADGGNSDVRRLILTTSLQRPIQLSRWGAERYFPGLVFVPP